MEFLKDTAWYLPGIIVFNVALYWVVVGVTLAVLRVLPSAYKSRRVIGDRKVRPGQIRREILTSMRSALIFSAVAAVVVAATDRGWTRMYGDDGAAHNYSLAWGVFATVLLIVLQDTWFYWTHRAFHHRLLYKRFHSVHHKSRYPTPDTAYAFDSGEAFSNAIYILLAAWIFPYPMWGLVLFMVHMLVRNVVGHSGYSLFPARSDGRPLVGIVNTTLHHDLHHTANRGNFGLYFTFWDRVMGTEHPEYIERLVEHNLGTQSSVTPPTPVG